MLFYILIACAVICSLSVDHNGKFIEPSTKMLISKTFEECPLIRGGHLSQYFWLPPLLRGDTMIGVFGEYICNPTSRNESYYVVKPFSSMWSGIFEKIVQAYIFKWKDSNGNPSFSTSEKEWMSKIGYVLRRKIKYNQEIMFHYKNEYISVSIDGVLKPIQNSNTLRIPLKEFNHVMDMITRSSLKKTYGTTSII